MIIPSEYSVLRTPDFVVISGPNGDVVLRRDLIAIMLIGLIEVDLPMSSVGMSVAMSMIAA